jgi:hypothetical protein
MQYVPCNRCVSVASYIAIEAHSKLPVCFWDPSLIAASHPVSQGDPTYLIVTDNDIEKFGLNAVCTHLGCVVPWVGVSSRLNSVSPGWA